jgi:hypothetical protein
MDMDLAVAKLNLAGVAMSRRRKEATNLLTKQKKITRHVERANYHDERSNEKYNTQKGK